MLADQGVWMPPRVECRDDQIQHQDVHYTSPVPWFAHRGGLLLHQEKAGLMAHSRVHSGNDLMEHLQMGIPITSVRSYFYLHILIIILVVRTSSVIRALPAGVAAAMVIFGVALALQHV